MSLHRAALAIVLALVCTVRGTSTDRQQSAQSQSGTATITGTVVTLSSGEPIADASVNLYESTLPDGRISTTTDSQGRFGFTKLASGRYTVGAVKTGFVTVVLGERHYGRGGRAMAIRDSEHRDIRLQLPRPSVITGTVTGQLVEVKRQDLRGIAVTLTDRRTELSGTIMTDKGEPAPEYFILLYPSDEKYWTPYSGRLYGTRANQDGTFVIGGFHAGSYRLATLLDAELGAWFDPAFLRRIDSTSMAVSIADEERKVLNLRVPGDR
jgi:hypothetical protein